jgi:multimeric flavodoxin WrbA
VKKKLLAFSSSPRRGGNSETLLKEFCRAADDTHWEVEMIRINNLEFKPCQACDLCARDGQCILKDNMQDIYPKLSASDALVIATPVTFGSVNAQLKMFIDRFQCWWNAKYTLKKPFIPDDAKHPGFFICVGALKKKDYCENAEQIIRVYFHNINHTLIGSLAFRGYDEKGAVAKDPEALEKTYRSGQDFFNKIDKN